MISDHMRFHHTSQARSEIAGNTDHINFTSTGIIESSGEKTEDEMKESTFLDVLNAGNEETIWKIDSRKNNGYPYLAWEDE